MRGKNIIWLCLMAVLFASPMVVNIGFATPSTVMKVLPPIVETNPTETFLIIMYLENAMEVAGWQFYITWDLDLTEFPPTVYEGDFLTTNYAGPETPTTHMEVVENFLFKYVLVSAWLEVPGSATGSGALATMEFEIKATESGSSVLDIYDTLIWDEDGNELAHTAEDGFFYTTKPKVLFDMTPSAPIPGEEVTFDGTASYDPDGGDILGYKWDFGDGSPPEYGPIVTHTYANYQPMPYEVTLTCTDDEAEEWYLTQSLLIWRDLGIVSVWPSMDEWDTTHFDSYRTFIDPYEGLPGLLWVLVTVVNFGTLTETYDVTVYADADTTVIGDEYELFPGLRTTTIAPGTGTGFGLWYVLDISYGASSWGVNDFVPTGQYTITAVISCAADQDPTNDIVQVGFGVHGSVEMTHVLRASAGRADHVYKLKHGPITFGGKIANFDNIFDIMRVEQGEWGRIIFEIVDEAGMLVATLKTDAVYLEYMEESGQLKATWTELAVGTYDAIAYAEFGTDGETFPHWGDDEFTFSFSII